MSESRFIRPFRHRMINSLIFTHVRTNIHLASEFIEGSLGFGSVTIADECMSLTNDDETKVYNEKSISALTRVMQKTKELRLN